MAASKSPFGIGLSVMPNVVVKQGRLGVGEVKTRNTIANVLKNEYKDRFMASAGMNVR